MLYRAIVFDFDGVLVNSEGAHGLGLSRAAADFGMTVREEQEDWYVGLGDHECFARIAASSGRELDPGLLRSLIARKAEVFSQLCREGHALPYPGSFELVRDAAARGPIAVCTGSHRRDIEPLLERHGVLGLLSALVTADDVTKTKPDPEPYRLVASRLGVEPRECIAIEDSPAGIASATGAGLRVYAVCHNFPRERLGSAHEIHACIEDVARVLFEDR